MAMSLGPSHLNAGVMLLNMRTLRDTYNDFRRFIFTGKDLNWEMGPGDQGAYMTFYWDEVSSIE